MVRLLRRIEISISSWLTPISAFWLLVAEPAEAWLFTFYLTLVHTHFNYPLKVGIAHPNQVQTFS